MVWSFQWMSRELCLLIYVYCLMSSISEITIRSWAVTGRLVLCIILSMTRSKLVCEQGSRRTAVCCCPMSLQQRNRRYSGDSRQKEDTLGSTEFVKCRILHERRKTVEDLVNYNIIISELYMLHIQFIQSMSINCSKDLPKKVLRLRSLKITNLK